MHSIERRVCWASWLKTRTCPMSLRKTSRTTSTRRTSANCATHSSRKWSTRDITAANATAPSAKSARTTRGSWRRRTTLSIGFATFATHSYPIISWSRISRLLLRRKRSRWKCTSSNSSSSISKKTPSSSKTMTIKPSSRLFCKMS